MFSHLLNDVCGGDFMFKWKKMMDKQDVLRISLVTINRAVAKARSILKFYPINVIQLKAIKKRWARSCNKICYKIYKALLRADTAGSGLQKRTLKPSCHGRHENDNRCHFQERLVHLRTGICENPDEIKVLVIIHFSYFLGFIFSYASP